MIVDKGKKLLSLQALRGYAIIGVFLCHEHVLEAGGQWGVSIFFMLSGFLLTYKNFKPNILNCSVKNNFIFATNKMKKLYPLHVLTMIMGILLELLQYGINNKIEFFLKIISNTFLLQSWIPKESFYFSFNGVTWYLSTLFFLYFTFPYLIKIIQKYRINSIAIINMIISYLILIGVGKLFSMTNIDLTWSNYVFPMYRILDFFIGCNLGYLVINQKKKEKNVIKSSIIEIIALVIAVLSMFKFYDASQWYQHTVLFVLNSISLIYVFAINKGVLTKLLTNKVMIFIGNMSPYIFLFHRLVIHWIWLIITPKYINIHINKGLECLISFLITLILSLLWRKIESRRINVI